MDTLTTELPGGAKMEFVWIPPGAFAMGSPKTESGHREDEDPQHGVTITEGFYLGRCVITQGQWQPVTGAAPWTRKGYVQIAAANPAVYISWDDVQDFIQTLNEAAGEALYRLPTEAEWEYACRAGTTTAWSFGDDERRLQDHAWFDRNAEQAGMDWAQPVGAKLPNPWGLSDMHGNVAEWIQDGYGDYSSGTQVDPRGLEDDMIRVVRGGSFDTHARGTRSAARYGGAQDVTYFHIGARLVKAGDRLGQEHRGPHPGARSGPQVPGRAVGEMVTSLEED
ncbi:MAG: formylglycine-generating enzyme family protein [Candidatus Latescibacterota bacterium]|jgi:formylglycine-generating enzyme required for sulfatase activity